MKLFNLKNLKACETCEGTTMLIQDSGLMKGMVKPCPDCAWDYKKFINQYGSDQEEQPEAYIDVDAGIIQVVKPDDNVIVLPGGVLYDLESKQSYQL